MLFTIDERVWPGTWPRSTRCAAHTIRLPPTRLFTATLTTALSPTTRATALPAPRGTLTLTHVARSPPSRDAASPLHPHLHPHQARVTVGRSIAIVGQLRHPSRSARAVDARAAASQPTEPLQPDPSRAARAGRRPSRHPSSSLRYPPIRVVAARAAAVPRAGTRGSHRPSPVGCPRPPLCLSQGPVCPPIFSPLRGGLGQFPRSSAVNMQKMGGKQ